LRNQNVLAPVFVRLRCLIFVVVAATWGQAFAASADVVVHSTRGEFGDIKERVLHAIENRGLVLNYTARIGAMLERTGKDIGAARQVYGAAELLEFCSAAASRAVMEADPHHIAFCPYGIAVYTLPKEPGKVYLSYRRQGASATGALARPLQAVDRLLAEIVGEALK
jgi:uncharacterized protein (DUF302 family)